LWELDERWGQGQWNTITDTGPSPSTSNKRWLLHGGEEAIPKELSKEIF